MDENGRSAHTARTDATSDMLAVSATLSRSEQFAFARHAVLAQLRELPRTIAARLGWHAGDSALTLAADPPDSSYTRRAHALAEETYRPQLLHHCLRCWYFADLFAQIERQVYDPELLYVAALMHDVALTDAHRPTATDPPCFAVHGGNLASGTLRAWGAADSFAQSVATAIALHMNVSVPIGQGVEAHLLHAATHLDVAGAGVAKLPRSLIRQVNIQQPRDGFTGAFVEAMCREAGEHPDSRTAVLWKLGLRIPIALNPINALG
jgi:hypothetical protein